MPHFNHKDLLPRLLRFAVVAILVVLFTIFGLLTEAKTAIAQHNISDYQYLADDLPEYSTFGTQTFGSIRLNRDGEIAGVSEEIADQMGYNTGRNWTAGARLSDVIKLGDLGQSLYPQVFSLADVGRVSGIYNSNIALSNFTKLLSQQSLGTLTSITNIQDLRLGQVKPVQAVFEAAVRPKLEQIAGQTGDLLQDELLAFDPDSYVQAELLKFEQQTIGDLITSPDSLLGNTTFGDISFVNGDVLAQYSIADIPGLENLPLGEIDGWQDLTLSQIPGLDSIPLGDFPNPIAAITGGFGGTHDVTYGNKEHRSTPTKFSITGSDQAGFGVQCAQERGCAYLELEGPNQMHGAQWIAGGTGDGQQMVEGGSGLLKIVNGGKEPTGRVPFGDVFKIVLTDTIESEGIGNFALYTRYCQKSFFVDLGCTPYFIGPIPLWSTQEKGFVLTGPLDGKGGATGGLAVPPELQQYQSTNVGGSYYGFSGGSPIQMDEECLDALIGALRHPGEAINARKHIPRIIGAAHEAGITDKAQIAYILGTISTELEGIWAPTGERGVDCGTYGSGCYYGRGYVQLTWRDNYEKLGQVLGVDLVNNPELANDPDLAAKITVIGMRDGLFTGVGLDDYIGGGTADFRNARRIVNDGDKMDFTAVQAERFLGALNSCSTLETTTADPPGNINGSIMDAVKKVQDQGFSAYSIPGTDNGNLGCAGMVNYVLNAAGIQTLGGGPPYGSLAVSGVEKALQGGRGIAVSATEAQPGDINIIDMGGKQHIGICLNVGCTQVVSNSSSRARRREPSFTWVSDGYFTPSYGGGRRAIYRVTS